MRRFGASLLPLRFCSLFPSFWELLRPLTAGIDVHILSGHPLHISIARSSQVLRQKTVKLLGTICARPCANSIQCWQHHRAEEWLVALPHSFPPAGRRSSSTCTLPFSASTFQRHHPPCIRTASRSNPDILRIPRASLSMTSISAAAFVNSALASCCCAAMAHRLMPGISAITVRLILKPTRYRFQTSPSTCAMF